MSNLPPFSAVIFCASPLQSALTALRYCGTASLLLPGDVTGTGAGAAGCWAGEQAATRTQLLTATATATARIRPMVTMVGATELAARVRGHFVVQTIYRRYGVSG